MRKKSIKHDFNVCIVKADALHFGDNRNHIVTEGPECWVNRDPKELIKHYDTSHNNTVRVSKCIICGKPFKP